VDPLFAAEQVAVGWNDRPKSGERWRKRVGGKTETRTVIDRTLGAQIVYVRGRVPKPNRAFDYPSEKRCTKAEWFAWQAGAKELEPR